MADSLRGKSSDMKNQGRKKVKSDSIYCDLCFKAGDKKTPAGFCVECQHFLCDNCYQYHCIPTPMRHHRLLGKSQMPKKRIDYSLSEICTQHEGEEIKFYCKTDNTAGCSLCMIDHMQSHEVSTLKDMAKDVEQSTAYKEFRMRMETLKTNMENQKQTAKENIAVSKTCKESALSHINDLQGEINKQFVSLKEQIVKKAEENEAKDIRKIQEVEDSANNAKDSLNHVKEVFQILEETKQSKQLFIALNIGHEKLETLEKELEDIQKENKIEQYNFVPNKFLTSMLKNIDALGDLCVKGEEDLNGIYGNYPGYGMPRGSPISENKCITIGTIYNWVRLHNYDTLPAFVTEKILSSCPWDVATVAEDNFAVTMPNEKKIKIMSVDNENITENKEISLNARCEGIDYKKGQLFVACSKPAKVLILHKAGIILQNISMDQEGKPLFKQPAYITFHEKKRLICVSDRKASCIVAMTTDGKVERVFKNEKWKIPLTVTHDKDEIGISDFETLKTFNIDLTTGEYTNGDENGEKNVFALAKAFRKKSFYSLFGFD